MWNLLVALVFLAEIRLGTLWRDSLGLAAINAALLLALRYAFLGRQERRVMVLNSWAAWGWVMGAVWAALHLSPLWQGVLIALGLLAGFAMLTETLGAAGWQRFIRAAPGEWQQPGPQTKNTALFGGPFRLQPDPRSEKQWEVYTYTGHYVHSHATWQDTETWVLDRYRAYRLSQGLSTELPEAQTASGTGASPSRWTQPNLSAAEVLACSPFVLVGNPPGGATAVRYKPDGTREIVSFDEVDDPTLAGYPPIRPYSGFALFVRYRGDSLGQFEDLAAAEAEILRRYAAQWPAPQRKAEQDDEPTDPSSTLN